MIFSAENFFNSLDMFGIRLGLDATGDLLARAGHPEKNLRFIHLAGTNGKGSTGAMLERAFRGAGFTTGFYTSPHLIDIRERFRVNGIAVPSGDFNRMTAELAECAAGGKFTYFEFATVLAAFIFCRAGADIVIWETGMGGRLDATNAVTPEAAVITNIAFDHENHLGSTLAAIAGEKAGIIKPGKPVFCGSMPDEARKVIAGQAEKTGSEFIQPSSPAEAVSYRQIAGRLLQCFEYDGFEVKLALPGTMQRRNFALAYTVLKHFAPLWHFDLAKAVDAMSEVQWPARCQRLNERLIIDGGHNPDGAAALSEALREIYPDEKFIIVYGAFADKAYGECMKLLATIADRFIFTPIAETGRACLDPAEAGKTAAGYGVPFETAPDAVTAVKQALQHSGKQVLAAGSLYLAGELLKEFAAPEAVLNL